MLVSRNEIPDFRWAFRLKERDGYRFLSGPACAHCDFQDPIDGFFIDGARTVPVSVFGPGPEGNAIASRPAGLVEEYIDDIEPVNPTVAVIAFVQAPGGQNAQGPVRIHFDFGYRSVLMAVKQQIRRVGQQPIRKVRIEKVR